MVGPLVHALGGAYEDEVQQPQARPYGAAWGDWHVHHWGALRPVMDMLVRVGIHTCTY